MEILSHDEITQILDAIKDGETDIENFKPSPDSQKIKIYDFKRPDKFSKEQIRTLSIIHEVFSRLITTSLSAQLRSMTHVHVASVDQLDYEEFIRSIPTPTTMAVMYLTPLQGKFAMEIDPDITFAIIDRLVGGSGDKCKNQHELSNIEQAIMKEIVIRMLERLQEAWAKIFNFNLSLCEIETNSQFTNLTSPTEMGALITFEVKIGHVDGIINIFYPYDQIKEIVGFLGQVYYYCDHPVNKDNIPVKLTAEILTREYSIKDINEWIKSTELLPLHPLIPHQSFLKLGNNRVWQCEILPDNRWFKKKIKIIGYTEKQFGTEGKKMEANQSIQIVKDALLTANIKVTVELGSISMSIKEIYEIGEGTILELDKLAGEPVDIKANGVLIAKGETVVINEYFGVRVIETEEKDTEDENKENKAV